ncbi:MAG: YeeE/YedE family protein [Cytophagaceae bacterium]|nr:YeeE/YedE family protein [Cytophagaceae bacterium]MDW8455215.1 YeeE/YedE thiosulfate transporter family protein [Cytophagaceae bacterium]
MRMIKYFVIGIYFGIVLTKAEVISWYRIQEMFRFQSFHMYGIIGSAVAVGAASIFAIKKFKIKTLNGEEVKTEPKKFHKGFIIGGIMFGMGWALTGACPGPLFALVGNGYSVIIIVIISALAGTFTYGLIKTKLPH